MTENNNYKDDEILSNHDITSHTAGLWKYNVIPEIPERFPEYVNNYEKTNSAEVIAARVRGKKHKHDGSNCDDWYEYKFIGSWTVAAVADGAGSKPLSRIGAKESCLAVVSYLERELSGVKKSAPGFTGDLGLAFDNPVFTSACTRLAAILQGSLNEAFKAVENAYVKRRESQEIFDELQRVPELKDFSATLLAAIIIPVTVDGNNEHIVLAVQIGDGMIATVNKQAVFTDALRILGNADSGSFAGETEFLTSEQMRTTEALMSRTKLQRRKISSVLLMTDGVADDYYPGNPQLLRLYLDLQLNDILKAGDGVSGGGYGYEELIPEPVSYPWVNDSDISYAIQYARNVIDKTGVSLEKLWDSPDIIRRAALKSFGIAHDSNDASEQLSVWLDNYVERGSFDDRTLVIINMED